MDCSHIAHRYLVTLGTSLFKLKLLVADGFCSAEIIKIEHPTRGDDTRSWGPPDAPYIDGVERQFPGESAYYLSVILSSPNSI
jgi:hypothetical protein